MRHITFTRPFIYRGPRHPERYIFVPCIVGIMKKGETWGQYPGEKPRPLTYRYDLHVNLWLVQFHTSWLSKI